MRKNENNIEKLVQITEICEDAFFLVCRFWFKSIPTTKEFSTRPFRNLRNMLSRGGLVMVLCLACVMASADDAACALQKPLGKVKIRDCEVDAVHFSFRLSCFTPIAPLILKGGL